MIFKTNLILLSSFLIVSCSLKSERTSQKDDLNKDHYDINLNNSNTNQGSVLQSYDCDSFQYNVSEKYIVDKNGVPFLSKKDSSDLINYALKNDQIRYAIWGKDTVLWRLFYLLPRTRNIINAQLYDSILNTNDAFFLNGLEKSQMHDLTNADAVIIGRVIDKRYVRDTIKCFYYKTEYIVRVDEVLHSYFKLERNNIVLLNSNATGYEGACNPKDPKLFGSIANMREFKIGDKWIFLLNHSDYYSKFLFRITKESSYADKYCSRAFDMYSGNNLYNYGNESLVNNIRSFYKLLFKN